MVWDIFTPRRWAEKRRQEKLDYLRTTVNKFFENLETRGGIVDNHAVLFVYNPQAPELSYILTEQL